MAHRHRPAPRNTVASGLMLRVGGLTLVALLALGFLWRLTQSLDSGPVPAPAGLPDENARPEPRVDRARLGPVWTATAGLAASRLEETLVLLAAVHPMLPVPELVLFDDPIIQIPAVVAVAGTGFLGGEASLDVRSLVQLALLGHFRTPPEEPPPAEPPDRAPLLLANRLADVRDGTPVGKGPRGPNDENLDEHYVYCYVLYEAHRTPAPAFARSTRNDLTFAHLYRETGKYRGEVVHVEGRLKRLRRYDPPLAAAEQGVRHLYEGWVFMDGAGGNPVCVVFTELPPGLKPAESLDRRVAFDGYLFKRWRYKSVRTEGTNEWQQAPLLIGHTLVLAETAAAPAEGWTSPLLPLFLLGLFALVLAVALGLVWWFRRSDRRVRARVAALAAPAFVEPAVPVATPVARPVHENGHGPAAPG